MKIRQKRSRKLVAGNICRRSKRLALAKRDKMIFPSHHFSGSIHSAFQEMKSCGTIMIVMKIVLARPQELDWNARLLRDRRRLQHVIVRQPPPESSARPFQMHDDVVVRNS